MVWASGNIGVSDDWMYQPVERWRWQGRDVRGGKGRRWKERVDLRIMKVAWILHPYNGPVCQVPIVLSCPNIIIWCQTCCAHSVVVEEMLTLCQNKWWWCPWWCYICCVVPIVLLCPLCCAHYVFVSIVLCPLMLLWPLCWGIHMRFAIFLLQILYLFHLEYYFYKPSCLRGQVSGNNLVASQNILNVLGCCKIFIS